MNHIFYKHTAEMLREEKSRVESNSPKSVSLIAKLDEAARVMDDLKRMM